MSGSETKTTKEVETGELSPLGEEFLNDLYAPMIAASLDAAGFDVDYVEKEVYEDEAQANSLLSKIKSYDSELAEVDELISSYVPDDKGTYTSGDPTLNSYNKRREALLSKRDKANDELLGIPKQTIPDFEINKREDPRVQQAINEFGADSPEVQSARDSIQDEEVFEAESVAAAKAGFFEKMVKFVNGDMTYTPEDRAQVLSYTGPIKDAINTAATNIISQVDDSYGQIGATLDSGYDRMTSMLDGNFDALSQGFDDLSDKIRASGYEVEDALKAASVQVRQGRDDLFGMLDELTASDEAKTKFELDLLYQEAEESSAQQAALLGLPPGSMTEKEMAMEMKTNAFKSAMMDLSLRKMQGKMGVATQTQDKLDRISLATAEQKIANINQLTGVDKAKLESMANLFSKKENFLAGFLDQKSKLEASKQGAVMQAVASREDQMVGMEKSEADMLQQKVYGQVPQMMAAGQQGMQQPALGASQQQALFSTGMGPVANIFGQEQERTFAETRTDITEKRSPGFLDTITDIAGAGLSGASMFMDPTGTASSAAKGAASGIGAGFGKKFV